MDAKFKKKVILCLSRTQPDDDDGLLVKFVQKWARDRPGVEQFVRGLSLDELWYADADLTKLGELDATLSRVMAAYYGLAPVLSHVAEVNRLVADESTLFDGDVAGGFIVRTFVAHCRRTGQAALLEQHLIVDAEVLWRRTMAELAVATGRAGVLVCYHLVDAGFELLGDGGDVSTAAATSLRQECLLDVLDAFEYSDACGCLVGLALAKTPRRCLLRLVFHFYDSVKITSVGDLKKCICILAELFARLSDEELTAIDVVPPSAGDADDSDRTLVDFLLQDFILTHVSHLEPDVRALSVRALGLAAVLRHSVAEGFLGLLVQVSSEGDQGLRNGQWSLWW